MNKNNSLIKVKDNAFSKLFKFFGNLYNKIFKKKTYIQKDDKGDLQKDDREYLSWEDLIENYPYEEYNYKEVENFSQEKSKKEFFELYSDIQNDRKKIDSLNNIQLIQINAMMKEELNLKFYVNNDIINK